MVFNGHHIGTTRMSAEAGDGVVDKNLRMHAVDNLYVGGSFGLGVNRDFESERSRSSPSSIRLSKEDASRLIASGLLSGARAGELTRLDWGDIDFANKRISLFRPKTRTGTSIPLHSALAAKLKRVKKARGKVGDSDPVFLSRNGTRYVSYKRAWATAVRRAGLGDRKGLVFHSLRHSFATAFLQNGAAITDLKELLGHQSITTTQIYAGMVDRRARASLEAVEFA